MTTTLTADHPLVTAATALVPPGGRALLGIAGEPGAGKSTLAGALVDALGAAHGAGWAALVPMDGFHLADVQLDRLGLRDRKGAPQTFDAAGYAALLARLRTDTARPVYAPGFERTLEQPLAGAVVVTPATRLVVTEGNYLLLPEGDWPEARAALDAVWFVEGDPDLRRARLVARHVEFGKPPAAAEAWVDRVDEANAALVRAGRATADLLVHASDDGWSPAG